MQFTSVVDITVGKPTFLWLFFELDETSSRHRFNGLPPTGKPATITAINILRIANGMIVEHVSEADTPGVLQQLGVVPAAGEVQS